MAIRFQSPAAGRSTRRRAPALLAALAALAAVAAPARAQVGPAPTFVGLVVDSATGAGVAGADVTVRGQRATTDGRGEFRLYLPRTAHDTVRVRRLGFRARAIPLAPGADPLALRLALASIPQQLAPVVVEAAFEGFSGRLAGYYQRLSRRTTGQFVTREDLDRERTGLLTNVLQRLPGIQVKRGFAAPVLSLRGRNCVPLVWLDGVAMPAGAVDLDAFSPSSLHGIEVYLGAMSAPQRFQASHGRSECGTIVLWSRGPDTDPIDSRTSVPPAEYERMIATRHVYTADEVDTAALPTNALVVEYPQDLKAANVSGATVVEFIVDTTGYVEAGSFGVVSATNGSFADAAIRALRGMTFTPARRRGAVVRQLVRQRFTFGEPASSSGP